MLSARPALTALALSLGGAFMACSGGEDQAAPQDAAASFAASPTTRPNDQTELTAAPAPDGWVTYTDAQLGLSFPHPEGLTLRESMFEEHAAGECPAVKARIASLIDENQVGKVGVVVAPNPCNLSLEEWIRTFPGWPCEPNGSPTCDPVNLAIAGERAIRFSLDVLGEPAATIYFAHTRFVYALGGNVYGSGEARIAATLSEDDFQRVVAGFRFAD